MKLRTRLRPQSSYSRRLSHLRRHRAGHALGQAHAFVGQAVTDIPAIARFRSRLHQTEAAMTEAQQVPGHVRKRHALMPRKLGASTIWIASHEKEDW